MTGWECWLHMVIYHPLCMILLDITFKSYATNYMTISTLLWSWLDKKIKLETKEIRIVMQMVSFIRLLLFWLSRFMYTFKCFWKKKNQKKFDDWQASMKFSGLDSVINLSIKVSTFSYKASLNILNWKVAWIWAIIFILFPHSFSIIVSKTWQYLWQNILWTVFTCRQML